MSLMPENISSYGSEIDSLILLITTLAGIALFIAMSLFVYSLIVFRKKPGVKAQYILGERWVHLKWIFVPVMVILCLDLYIDGQTHHAWQLIKEYLPSQPDVSIRVVGQQFSWSFKYPGQDGNWGSPGEFSSTNELHVPVDKDVLFYLESKDVIHSFWVPSLRLKQDVVPGRTIRGWFKATKEGEYDIGCAQICGNGHGLMHAKLVVHSSEDYDRWVAQQRGGGAAAAGASDNPRVANGLKLYQTKACIGCHSLDGSKLVGPSWKGLFGRSETVVTNGKEHDVTVDEAYVRKSILEPQADVVKGFQPVMPPQQGVLTDEEIGDLIEFIKTVK